MRKKYLSSSDMLPHSSRCVSGIIFHGSLIGHLSRRLRVVCQVLEEFAHYIFSNDFLFHTMRQSVMLSGEENLDLGEGSLSSDPSLLGMLVAL